jgi:3-phosphoshikimate 1-carboxyvinyltransferase
MDYRIFPPEEMIETTVELPLSKSICNRLLIINALNPTATPMEVVADCDDSRSMADILSHRDQATGGQRFDVGAAGTAFRFLTAYFAATEGSDIVLDGSERLRQRPIAALVDALRQLGAEITYVDKDGFAPLAIKGHRLRGGDITMDATISSQFISALIMVAPTMNAPLKLTLEGELISRPYIKMTVSLLEQAGVDVDFTRNQVTVANTLPTTQLNDIERDWSAASYWYEITALSAGFVTLPGLTVESLQGDAAVARFFSQLGVITNQSEEVDDALEICPDPEQYSRFEQDLSENPDIAQTIAVTCAMLGIPFHLRGLSTLRVKETDRLEALRAELDRFGIIVEIRNNSELVWNLERHPIFEMPVINTYNDHRMAMAFAPAALYVPGIVIRDIEVVSKSYPQYWDHLRSAGFNIADAARPIEESEE